MSFAFGMIFTVLRAIKFRLYPNCAQSATLSECVESSRRVFNQALEHRINAIKPNGKGIDYPIQQKQLTFQRMADPAMTAVPVQAQRDGLRRVDVAFKNFFRRCREGAKRKGFPRFKSKARYNSFTVANANEFVKDGRVRLPCIKQSIRCRGLQPIHGKQKRLTIVRRADKWFGRILVDDAQLIPPKRPIKSSVGIDLGLNHFVATSDGGAVECPKHYRRLHPSLRRAQRLLSRRKRGSNRWKRALNRVQRIHAKIADCRDDFTHKLSKQIVRDYDFIAAENLNIRGMIRSKLAKSILDAGWGQFLFRLSYKAESAGKTFIQENARYTSQECSQCGKIIPKTLLERIHDCPCGLRIDRDVNAARNVLRRALLSFSTPPKVIRGTREEGSASTVGSRRRQVVPLSRAD